MALHPLSGNQFKIDSATGDISLVDADGSTEMAIFSTTPKLIELEQTRSIKLYEEADEDAYIGIQLGETVVGTADAVTYTNLEYRWGNITNNGPYGPQLLMKCYDDVLAARIIGSWERSGTFAVVRDKVAGVGEPGSCYEAFYNEEVYPVFRLSAGADGHYWQMRGALLDADNYIWIRRPYEGATDLDGFEIVKTLAGAPSTACFLRYQYWDPPSGSWCVPRAAVGHIWDAPALAANVFTVDLRNSNSIYLDLAAATGNVTINLTQGYSGGWWRIITKQCVTAGPWTATWQGGGGANPIWSANGGAGQPNQPPALTAVAGLRDQYIVGFDGTNYFVNQEFADT